MARGKSKIIKDDKPKPDPNNTSNANNSSSTSTSNSNDKSKAVTSGPNTKTQAYISAYHSAPSCSKNKSDIATACKAEPAQSEEDKKRNPQKKEGLMGVVSKASHAMDTLGRVGYKRDDANAWLDTHCDFMWLKPSGISKVGEEFNKNLIAGLETIKAEKWTLARHAMGELTSVAMEKAGTAATKKLAALGARSVAKNVVGGAAVVVTAGTAGSVLEAGMLAWTATDMIETATELAALVGEEGVLLLENLKDSLNIKEKVDGMLDELKKSPDKALADAMEMAGKFNSCLRFKRCQLVSMAQTSARKAKESGQGCCPGQTGHHLLPKEMFVRKIDVEIPVKVSEDRETKPEIEKRNDPSNCEDYTNSMHKNAPVVCVEGTNQYGGSHGKIHGKIDELMKRHRLKHGDQISNEEAMDTAVKSHQETFKTGCNPDCLKAQLKEYYGQLCVGQLKPRGGTGKDTEDTEEQVDNGMDID